MVKRTIGTRRGFLLQILLPSVVIAVLVGFMGGEAAVRTGIAYINQDAQEESSAFLLQQLQERGNYELIPFDDVGAMKDYLIKFKASLGISTPSTFTSDLKSGKQPSVEVYEMATSEESYIARVTLNTEIAKLHGIALQAYASGDEQENNQKFTSILNEVSKGKITSQTVDLQLYPKRGISLVTGFTLMFLMGLVSNTVSQIVEDRSQRTMARIFTAPVSSAQITVGNFLGSVFVGLLQIIIVLSISRGVMGYDYGVDFFPHLLILGAFMLVTMGLASTVAGLIRNPQNTGMLNNLIIFPTCMLGGCFWPIMYMPDIMQRIANFMPQKWVIQALEQLSAGDALSSVTTPLSILGLMALILLVIGSAILRPQDSRVGL